MTRAMLRLTSLPAALLLAAAAVTSPAQATTSGLAPQADEDGGSLEGFLKRVRTEREAEYARLIPRVDELARRLGKTRTSTEARRVRAEIVALGSEAVPLLVPYLDPGDEPDSKRTKRARAVAKLLREARNPALLDDLGRMARTGSPEGRLLALRVLGDSVDSTRAVAALHALHAELEGALRAECLLSLARLAPDDDLILAGLADNHRDVLAAAVVALSGEPRKSPRKEVVALLNDPVRAADVLLELVAYFTVPGQKLNEGMLRTFVGFARRADLPLEVRLAVIRALPDFGVRLNSRLRKEIEPLLSSSDSALKDETLIALTLLGDSRARRELMRFYDDQVKNNDAWPLAYQRRGDIELRTGEYREATRDYRRALELHEDSARLPGNRDLWINLARAYMRDNKHKAAAGTLEELGMTSELRRTLGADPDFQPLVESSRYGDLFR